MSEFDGTEQEPEFDDHSYAEVRGLLADAREDVPMPADVVLKLEATLAGLVAEREETEQDIDQDAEQGDTVVVPLRRRSLAPRLLVAAAAVVLVGGVGVGLSQVMDNGSDSGHGTTAAGQTTADGAGSLADPESASGRNGSDEVPGAMAGGMLDSFSSKALAGPIAHFTKAKFDSQAVRYVRTAKRVSLAYGLRVPLTPLPVLPQTDAAVPPPLGAAPGAAGDYGTDSDGTGTGTGTASGSGPPDSGGSAAKDNSIDGLVKAFSSYRTTSLCPGPSPTDGSLVLRITFGKGPATLVLHPIVDGTQFVAAWSCDGTRLLAATTVRP